MKQLHEKIKEITAVANQYNRVSIYKNFKVNTGLYSRKALRIFDTIFDSECFDIKHIVNESLLIQNCFRITPKIGVAPAYTFLNDDGEIYFVVRADRTEYSCNASHIEILLMHYIIPAAYNLAYEGKLRDIRSIDIERLSNIFAGYDDSLNDPPTGFTKSDEEIYEEYEDMIGCPFNPIQNAAFTEMNKMRQELAERAIDEKISAKELIQIYKKQSNLYNDIMRLCE